ncbi:hypothetical protein BT69DRAFT_1347081 [Atractiella rhizophila]|nr:hypothetical protein BT69DRAFT_1347081 [Atractiella rhizophila]
MAGGDVVDKDLETAEVTDEKMDAVKDGKKKRAEAGAGWKGRKEEEHHLPKNRMWIVFTGLVLAVFLGALDQTLVSTALPAIVRDLGGANLYSWVGTSYLVRWALSQTSSSWRRGENVEDSITADQNFKPNLGKKT